MSAAPAAPEGLMVLPPLEQETHLYATPPSVPPMPPAPPGGNYGMYPPAPMPNRPPAPALSAPRPEPASTKYYVAASTELFFSALSVDSGCFAAPAANSPAAQYISTQAAANNPVCLIVVKQTEGTILGYALLNGGIFARSDLPARTAKELPEEWGAQLVRLSWMRVSQVVAPVLTSLLGSVGDAWQDKVVSQLQGPTHWVDAAELCDGAGRLIAAAVDEVSRSALPKDFLRSGGGRGGGFNGPFRGGGGGHFGRGAYGGPRGGGGYGPPMNGGGASPQPAYSSLHPPAPPAASHLSGPVASAPDQGMPLSHEQQYQQYLQHMHRNNPQPHHQSQQQHAPYAAPPQQQSYYAHTGAGYPPAMPQQHGGAAPGGNDVGW